jgi:uncharacterized protein with NRDE domain
MAFQLDPAAPLLVAANRDEKLDRPATAMTVLRASGPRILGGRDERAGGTWLAVNEHGLVAGLTNRPLPDGPDPARRSRGELPLVLAGHRHADHAVEEFVDRFSPADYNPAWFLVGDRRSLYSIDLTGGEGGRAERAVVRELGAGVHVLENAPPGAPSAKVDHVRRLLGSPEGLRGEAAMTALGRLLADHSTPAGAAVSDPASTSTPRRPESLAACVHTEDYGTRSSTLIRVPVDEDGPPRVLYTDGHPCRSSFVDAGALWGR